VDEVFAHYGVDLPLARQFNRSAYDAAYLTLAQDTGQQFITGDLRLYNAVHSQLNWVLWIEDYAGLPEDQSSG
jgi:hypothetical protein